MSINCPRYQVPLLRSAHSGISRPLPLCKTNLQVKRICKLPIHFLRDEVPLKWTWSADLRHKENIEWTSTHFLLHFNLQIRFFNLQIRFYLNVRVFQLAYSFFHLQIRFQLANSFYNLHIRFILQSRVSSLHIRFITCKYVK